MRAVEDRERAMKAHTAVSSVAGTDDWEAYRTILLKLPVMVQREGLPIALHFVAGRSKDGAKRILDHLAKDLGHKDRAMLLSWLRGLGPTEERLATREVQRRLGWYKRMAQAFGKDGVNPAGGGDA